MQSLHIYIADIAKTPVVMSWPIETLDYATSVDVLVCGTYWTSVFACYTQWDVFFGIIMSVIAESYSFSIDSVYLPYVNNYILDKLV